MDVVVHNGKEKVGSWYQGKTKTEKKWSGG